MNLAALIGIVFLLLFPKAELDEGAFDVSDTCSLPVADLDAKVLATTLLWRFSLCMDGVHGR